MKKESGNSAWPEGLTGPSKYAYALTAASVTGNAGDTINAATHVLDWYFAAAVGEITGENAGEPVTLC